MRVQTKYGSYYSKELYEKYTNLSYRDLQQECRMLRDNYGIDVRLSSKRNDLLDVIRYFYKNKYDLTRKKELATNPRKPPLPEMYRMYNCIIRDGKCFADEDIPMDGFIVCKNYKGVWYSLVSPEAPGIKYNVIQTDICRESEYGAKYHYKRATAIRDIKKASNCITIRQK